MTSRETARIVKQLSPAERIRLAQDLWDSVADEQEAWELTPEQRRELARRMKAQDERARPGKPRGASWASVKRRILAGSKR